MIEVCEHLANYPSDYPFDRPAYIAEACLLRRNLSLIRDVSEATGVEIIVAFKAFAGWRLFPFFREYGFTAAVSSLWEARLCNEELGKRGHAFSPAYLAKDFAEWQERCSHITFNSLSQATLLSSTATRKDIVYSLRLNPRYSPVETELYNPALPGSRFGVTAEELKGKLPTGIDGLHVHVLCESNSFQLERLLAKLDHDFAHVLGKAKRLNLGGGHLITHREYNVEHLIQVLKAFRQRYPHLALTLEPGSAFTWQTGYLLSHVVDVVHRDGIATAILDVSFTCHMPDCLEMPYQPNVRGAESISVGDIREQQSSNSNSGYSYRLGGNSCLSGDFMGNWRFPSPLNIGDPVIFEDMIHYTTVKTNMFNGVAHPDLVLHRDDGSYELLRHYSYDDYKSRMN